MSDNSEKPLVLVTGSSGLIGSRICRTLAEGYRVAGLDIAEPPEPTPAEPFHCDLTSDDSVRDALAAVRNRCGSQVASVVHLAAYYDFSGEPSPLYDDLTVEGTRRLLRGLRDFNPVEQFVFSSSLLVMKSCDPPDVLTESSPCEANWEYPASKLAAEEVIRQERGDISAVVLRLAGVYDEQGHSLPITQNIRRIAEKQLESYFYPGDPERGQSFVHLDDAVRCFAQVVEQRKKLDDYEVFLVAEEECLSYERLQDMIGELIHGVDDWPTLRIPKLVAKAGAWAKDQAADSEEERPFIKPWMVDLADAHYPVSNSRARVELNWQPLYRLSNTLPEMIERFKQDPRGWYELNGLPLPDDQQLLKQLANSDAR